MDCDSEGQRTFTSIVRFWTGFATLRAHSFGQGLGKRDRVFPLRITRSGIFVRWTSNLGQKNGAGASIAGTSGDVLEMLDEPSKKDRHPPRRVRRFKFNWRLARDSAGGGIRNTAKAAGRLLIGRVLSFRERTGIRSGDPYSAMLPRSSGPSTHILRSVLKMSEIRLRLVLRIATANGQIDDNWHLLC